MVGDALSNRRVTGVARIGIDATALTHRTSGGIGTSQYEIMMALSRIESEHEFVLYATAEPMVPFVGRPLPLPWEVRVGTGPTARSNILWMRTGAIRMLEQDGIDLFWGPRHLLPLRPSKMLKVATIHDFWFLRYPDQQPLGHRTLNRILTRSVLSHAHRLVVPSQATARDAIEHFGVDPQRIRVIPHGVNMDVFRTVSPEQVDFVREKYDIPDQYVLCLDVYNVRKGFVDVISALAALESDVGRHTSVVGIGSPRATARNVDPQAIANLHRISDRVRLPGDVSADELIALYCGAAAFIYPSMYEGFGMPVLEAMACACPVISSNASSLPEVVGDAGIMVDPHDVLALRQAMDAVLSDSHRADRLRALGLQRARRYSWRRSAEMLLAVFDETLAGGRP